MYDLIIVGAGVSGSFAAFKAIKQHNFKKILIIDYGKPPGKRRKKQLEGFLGCLPIGDGKLYVEDSTENNYNYVLDIIKQIGPSKITKTKLPKKPILDKITSLNFNYLKHDYIQWEPESAHKLSKEFSNDMSECIEYSFENEVFDIQKDNDFIIKTEKGEFKSKNVLISVGRSGWRWAYNLYNKLGLSVKNDFYEVGIRVELAAQYMPEFNKCHMSIYNDSINIGPICWEGTVIPEDHTDRVISSFRSNDERWKTDKVSFSFLRKFNKENCGAQETERLGKLAYIMYNDRVDREKIKSIIKKDSKLALIPEYNFLVDDIKYLENLIPHIVTRGYFHSPNINTNVFKVKLENSQTEIPGLFVSGESAGVSGIIQCAKSGCDAIDEIVKR